MHVEAFRNNGVRMKILVEYTAYAFEALLLYRIPLTTAAPAVPPVELRTKSSLDSSDTDNHGSIVSPTSLIHTGRKPELIIIRFRNIPSVSHCNQKYLFLTCRGRGETGGSMEWPAMLTISIFD